MCDFCCDCCLDCCENCTDVVCCFWCDIYICDIYDCEWNTDICTWCPCCEDPKMCCKCCDIHDMLEMCKPCLCTKEACKCHCEKCCLSGFLCCDCDCDNSNSIFNQEIFKCCDKGLNPIIKSLLSSLLNYDFSSDKCYVHLLHLLLLIFIFMTFIISFDYPIVLTSLVFIGLLIQYILNKVVDNTFDIVESSSEVEISSQAEEENPIGIDDELWNVRNNYSFNDNDISVTADLLIELGFSPDDILSLYDYMQRERTIQQTVRPLQRKTFLNLCDNFVECKLRKKNVNRYFPHNSSFMYIIYSTIITYLLLLTFSLYEEKTFVKKYCSLSIAISLYGIFSTLDIDVNSYSIGEMGNAFSRPCFIILMNLINILCDYILKRTENRVTKLTMFNLTIEWKYLLKGIKLYSEFFIFMVPTYLCFILSPIHVFITWFLDFIGRYAFGLNGSGGFFDSIASFIRSSAVTALVWAEFNYINSTLMNSISIGAALFLLHIPFSGESWLSWFKFTLQGLCAASITGAMYYVGLISNVEASIYSIIAITILVDIVYPSIVTKTQYLCFSLGYTGRKLPIMPYVSLLWHYLCPGLLIGVLFKHDSKLSPILQAFVVVLVINRCTSNPTAFAYGLIIFWTLTYEFMIDYWSWCILIGFAIARKGLTLIDVIKRFESAFGYIYDSIPMLDNHDIINLLLFDTFNFFVGFPGRQYFMMCHFWKFVTGGPFLYMDSKRLIYLPSSLRPNCMFDRLEKENIDVNKEIKSSIKYFPIETPLYMMTTLSLQKMLGKLIGLGYFGRVDENDFFLLYDDLMVIIVHIISLSPSAVKFQTRCLSIKESTVCHEEENNSLEYLQNDAHSSAFTRGLYNIAFSFSYLLRGLKIPSYSAPVLLFSTLINTSSKEVVSRWIVCCIAERIIANSTIALSVVTELTDYQEELQYVNFEEIINFFGPDLDENTKQQYLFILETISFGFLKNYDNVAKMLCSAFYGIPSFEEKYNWIEDDKLILDEIIIPAAKNSILALYLYEVGCIEDIALDDTLKSTFEKLETEFLVTTVKSEEFANEFVQKRKSILTLEKKGNDYELQFFTHSSTEWAVFHISRENVRDNWNTFMVSGLFFKLAEIDHRMKEEKKDYLSNIIYCSCDPPVGLASYISPVLTSYKQIL